MITLTSLKSKAINLNFKYILYFLLLVSFLLSLQNLFSPLVGDEKEYFSLARNILDEGKYYLYGTPNTYTPIVPGLIISTSIKGYPLIGIALARLFNILFAFGSMYFLNQVLIRTFIPVNIRYSILILTFTNNHFISFCSRLYPEAITIFLVWVFIYLFVRSFHKFNQFNWIGIILILSLLILTKYLYAVFGIFLCWIYFIQIKNNLNYKEQLRIIFKIIIGIIPLLIWFQYVINIESSVNSEHSYFKRFELYTLSDRILLGLGLKQDGRRLNGIPAIISLFFPKTGVRDWYSSLFLLTFAFFGIFLASKKNFTVRVLTIALSLVMLGLIYSATGFSRYWLPLLPVFLLGFWFSFKYLKLKQNYFSFISVITSSLYLVIQLKFLIQRFIA